MYQCYSGDHPRVCGEKTAFTSESELSAGSPPRMRGKAERVNVPRRFGRITPAYAGKSVRRENSSS